jgi:hypothetical protein
MDAIIASLQWLADFFGGTGDSLRNLIVEAAVWIIKKIAIWKIQTQLWAIDVAWNAAKSVLEDLQVFSKIATAFAGLDEGTRNILAFFKIPQAINVVLNAGVTRFVLRMFS